MLAAIITLRAILKRDGERLAILKREGESFTQLRARSPTIIHQWPFIRHKNQEVSLGVLVEVLDLLAGEEVKRGDMNRLLRRGALLHADIDRKMAGLKALQGMIWDEGYRQGAFAPQLYDDVLPVLTQWRTHGIRLGIYSSGSEQAQRLLFAYTNVGDVTSLFEHFFDTTVGEKKTSSSYRKISDQIGLPPPDILFLSDAELELDAAASIGFKDRPHRAAWNRCEYPPSYSSRPHAPAPCRIGIRANESFGIPQ